MFRRIPTILALGGGDRNASATGMLVVLGLFGALWLAIFLHGRRIGRLLRESTSQAASRLGLVYSEKWPDERRKALEHFSLFNKGHSRRVGNVAEGRRDGATTTMMTYRYATGSGKSRKVYDQSVVLFGGPIAGLPDFSLSPEDFGKRLSHRVMGRQDIDFEENEAGVRFSRLYELQGDDEDAIRRALGPRLVGHLSERPGWSMQAKSGQLLVWKPRWWTTLLGVKPAEEFVQFFEDVKDIRSQLS